ncbi:MAG: hypothetical protein Q4D57_03165 [Clostridia bacterium]|nr:hypothetical protein [Clostridia bacterium]
MNFLCLFFVALLLAVGFADLTKTILKRLMFQNKKAPIKEVKIPIYGHCENIEFIIRKIIFKYTWLNEYKNVKITIINNGADSETIDICNALKRKIINLHIA